jgi:transposase InsO family protein
MKLKASRTPLGDQQRPRRQQERQVRREVVAFGRWAARQGLPAAAAARQLGLRLGTLRHWRRRWCKDHLAAPDRGRPRHLADATTRSAVVEVLAELGPTLGVPALKQMFPTVVRSELNVLCRDHQRGLEIQTADAACHLTWRSPGRVWATDFTEPPQPIDGQFPYVLLIRDLASSRQLLALPAKAPEARIAVAALWELFVQYGAPLVLKADNGSCFIAQILLDLLLQYAVTPLFSPPLTPRYNGSIEAGNGSLKSHARQEALRHGRTVWTSDDLEAACLSANTFARPWGDTGPSPEQRWTARTPITSAERRRFQKTLAHLKTQVIIERGLGPADLTRRAVRSAVDRTATRRALECLGYLFVQRGPIRPLLKSEIGTFIT